MVIMGRISTTGALLLAGWILLAGQLCGLQNRPTGEPRGRTNAALPSSSGDRPVWQTVDPANLLVPQTLLSLSHAPEVQEELGLDDAQISQLEEFFRDRDGAWWRARNLPVPERREVIASLETGLLEALGEIKGPAAVARLRELEVQAQATRAFLRPDVSTAVGLSPDQIAELSSLAEETDRKAAERESAMRQGEPVEEKARTLEASRQKETELVAKWLRGGANDWKAVSGAAFPTNTLSRIFPMAPPLEESDGWIGNPPGNSAELKGKVVILHFYAFECINCQRNLPRYNEWRDRFAAEDVVIIGIQTPETARERKPDAIRDAAAEQSIRYPVLLDLQNRNWDAWSNTMWPTVYVIDRKGYIRMWWQGELNWQGATGDQDVVAMVERLLKE